MKTKEELKKDLLSVFRRYTYLDDEKVIEGLAKQVGGIIDNWVALVIEDIDMRKYCLEQAVHLGNKDPEVTVNSAEKIQEYLTRSAR